MQPRRAAIGLVLLGALLLGARLSGQTGWAWAALAAVGFLAGYARTGGYGLLVVGGTLTGVAVGLLFGGWGWPGAFPLSVGTGLLTVNGIEADRGSPIVPLLGALLVASGVVGTLLASSEVIAVPFALLVLAAGTAVLWRQRPRRARNAPSLVPPQPRRYDDPPPTARSAGDPTP